MIGRVPEFQPAGGGSVGDQPVDVLGDVSDDRIGRRNVRE